MPQEVRVQLTFRDARPERALQARPSVTASAHAFLSVRGIVTLPIASRRAKIGPHAIMRTLANIRSVACHGLDASPKRAHVRQVAHGALDDERHAQDQPIVAGVPFS